MSTSTLRKNLIIVTIAIALTVVLVGSLVYGLKGVIAGSGGGISATADQAYILNATTTATARSNSYDIQGAKMVTLFIGSAFDGVSTDEANFRFEVSDLPEPSQGTAKYGTTTPVTRAFDDAKIPVFVFGTTTPFTLAAGTYATTTVSLDLRQHTYSFLRVIRTTDTAGRSTSTVSIIRTY